MKKKTKLDSKTPILGFSDLDQADKSIVEQSVRKGLSRREILKISMALGVSTTIANDLFYSGQAAAATPKRGGSIRVAANSHGPADTLDPILGTASIDYSRARATYNSLIQIGEDLSANPELATEWSANSNASEWTFKLRKDVTWHDGKKLTADDVIWSMNRHMGEGSVSVIKPLLASISEWKKTGPYEVKAILGTPNSDLPVILSTFQAKITQNGVKKPTGVGTGPFKLEKFEPGVKSVHVRNEDYFRDGPHLDACEITAITDPIAAANALVSGGIDLTSNIDSKAIRQIESASNVDVTSIPSGAYIGLCILKNTSPGSNPDFVRGMQYIQDRKRIVKRILRGYGSIGNDQPISPAYGDDYCHELPQREFDPDKAKFHFKKSGISSAEIHAAPVASGLEDMCLLAQANCAKIGFDLKIKKVPSDGYWGSVWMKEPVNVVSWFMRPTANAMMSIAFAPGAAWNDTFWNNERMGKLLNLSLKELDPRKRHEMYCEMQTLIHNESGIVIPAHPNVVDGYSKRLKGIPKVPLSELASSEWPEYVWLDA